VEKRDPNAFDPLWKELNANETYSLLENKHTWTLVVKEFEGVSVIQVRSPSSSSSFLEMLGMGDKSGETLNAAALNAHNMAKALRDTKMLKEMKLDAYVFHTRRSSVVTVGGFDSLDDPQLKLLQTKITFPVGQQPQDLTKNGGKPADLAQLRLMAQPMPMKIPRPDK
jgi:hypothetical protein